MGSSGQRAKSRGRHLSSINSSKGEEGKADILKVVSELKAVNDISRGSERKWLKLREKIEEENLSVYSNKLVG
jgi:hypothetical protein